MARRDALIACQGMDADYYFYGEDSDLCYRIQQAGRKVYYLPHSAKIIHYGGISSTINLFDNNQRAKNLWGWKSRFLFMNKHFPLWKKMGILIAVLSAFGTNIALYGAAGIKRRDWNYVRVNLQAHWEITRAAFSIFHSKL